MTKRRRQKQRRRLARMERRGVKEHADPKPRVRRVFVAKARSGDAVELRFRFTGEPVPVDPDRPTQSLRERVVVSVAWRSLGYPTRGDA